MYEERKSSISVRDLAIQLLFIVLFVLVLLWIFPTKKNMKDYVNESNENKKPVTDEKVDNKGDNSTEKEILYEYVLASDGVFGEYGNWSDWSTSKVNQSSTTEVETDVRKEKTGTKNVTVQVGTKEEKYLVGIVTDYKNITGYTEEKYISGYKTEKVKVGEEKVQVGTTTQIVVEKYIKGYAEVYQKSDSSTYPPVDNDTYKYKNVKKNVTRPCGSCPEITTYTYDIYKVTPVYGTREIKKEVPVYEMRDVYETRQTPIYSIRKKPIYGTDTKETYATRTVPVYETKTEDIYSNVTYYRYRTRTYSGSKEDIKWSKSNKDTNLINQGYKLTGNVKEN